METPELKPAKPESSPGRPRSAGAAMRALPRVAKRSTKEAVITALQNYIVDNQLVAGDPLPPEHTLAQRLGVSRNIVREALQAFKTLGIIETRPKTGAVIKALLPAEPFKGYLPYLQNRGNSIRDIIEARQVVELGLVPALIATTDPAFVSELRQLADQLASCTAEQRPALEIRFHSRLLTVSGNSIILSLKSLLVDFFEKQPARAANAPSPKPPAAIASEHTAIAEAIAAGDAAALRRAITAHYRDYLTATTR